MKKLPRLTLMFRNLWITSLKRSTPDAARWQADASLDPAWDERTRLLAAWVPEGSTLIEFGAGRMTLPDFLPPNCRYTPSDLVSRAPSSLVIDLNAAILPELPPHDVAFFSGVLEYVADLPRLVEFLSRSVKMVIASYAVCDLNRNRLLRRASGWVNDYTIASLQRLFDAHGFTVTKQGLWKKQVLFRFEKR